MAGVHIVMVDEWGNRADAISKSGEADFGGYDLLINPFANRYTLTVVDEAGNIASPPVLVEHFQGAAGDAPCHTVVWIGGETEPGDRETRDTNNGHGDTETWRHGDMETWRHGDTETRRHGDTETRRHEIRRHGDTEKAVFWKLSVLSVPLW